MEYWKQVVMAQQQSGLSVTEYCRKQAFFCSISAWKMAKYAAK